MARVSPARVTAFLTGHRITVVGASDHHGNFGGTIVKALADHGYDAIPVHPHAETVGGRTCYSTLADVPWEAPTGRPRSRADDMVGVGS